MGYYDHEYRTNRKDYSWIKSGILGAVLGTVFTTSLFLYIIPNGLLNNQKTENAVAEPVVTTQTENEIREIYKSDIYTEISKAVEEVSAAVVGVNNIRESTGFFGFVEENQVGTGSGVIYKKSGDKAYVVTNHHVIEGAKKIEVTLHDGTKADATLVGEDVYTDLAVIEIDSSVVTKVAKLGDSDSLKLGEPVLAIGNPLGQQFSGSVTQGIVSGKGRAIPVDVNRDGRVDWHADVLQTDAAINPGNSGGALVNIRGELIGINSMKIARQEVEGIGLAIPMSIVKPVIDDLEMYHEVQRPYMGVELRPLADIPREYWSDPLGVPDHIHAGVAIVNVVPESPANKAGLQQYDVIVSLDDENVKDDIEIRKYLYRQKDIGDSMKVTYYRNGVKQVTELSLNKNTY